MVAINIGSGQRPFKPPFINVDCQAKWEPDLLVPPDPREWGDLMKSETADIIVLHHVLEHFGCGEADSLLSECRRILKPRGSLLVFVPDMAALANMWRRGLLSDQIYLTNVYGAYMGDEADRHKWGYSRESLHSYLRNHYSAVCPFDWREIQGADIARDTWIIGMEAIK